jgi:tripartite-type tricarboxylate transporter receptor subunit TctC
MHNHGITRRDMLKAISAGSALLTMPALAQDSSIRAISAFTPGGLTEQFFRPLWAQAQTALGQRTVIEYKPGATGAIALDFVAKAPPDGRTVLQFYSSMLLTPYLEAAPYDLLSDYTYIIALADVPYGVAVAANSPYKSLDDLFKAARSKPINYAIAGVGTGGHVMMEDALRRKDVKMTAVPYKGVEYIPALIGGHIDAAVGSTSWGAQVKGGNLRVLGYFTKDRIPAYPDVPSATELGLGILPAFPLGIVGPRGMAPATVKRLHDALKDAIDTPVMEKAMYDSGTPKMYKSTAEFTAWVPQAFTSHGELLNRLNLAKFKPMRRA